MTPVRSEGLCRLHRADVAIAAERPVWLDVATAILDYYGARRRPRDAMAPPEEICAEIILVAAAETSAIPTSARLEGDFGGVRAWVDGPRVWVDAEGFRFEVDLAAGRAVGRLGEGIWNRPQALGQGAIVPFVLTLMMLLRRHRLFAVHGAAVAHDGEGCVLLGAGGSGKSTQALGLVTAGWDHLSDDSLLIDGAGDKVEILALRRDFYLTPEAAAPFPDLATRWRECELTAGPKRLLAMAEVFPQQLAETCRPRCLLFPSIVDQEASHLAPLAKADALHQLLHQSDLVTLDPATAPVHLDTLKRLLDQTVSYRLLAGRDLRDDPSAVEPLLRSVLQPEEV